MNFFARHQKTIFAIMLSFFLNSCVHTEIEHEFSMFPKSFSATQVVRVNDERYKAREIIGYLKRVNGTMTVVFVEPLFLSPLVKLELGKGEKPIVTTDLPPDKQPFDFSKMGEIIGDLYFADKFTFNSDKSVGFTTDSTDYTLTRFRTFNGENFVLPSAIELSFKVAPDKQAPSISIETREASCP